MSFNTSHVPIYRGAYTNHFKQGTLFQYIPCSYLSNSLFHMIHNYASFNTSHVPIYQMGAAAPLVKQL